MKKLFVTIGIIVVVVFFLVVVITHFSDNKIDKKLETIKKEFLSNEKIKLVNKMDVYYGTDTYYVFEYVKNHDTYLGILDENGKTLVSVKKETLFSLDILNKYTYQIGYRENKIVYEVKKRNKTGFVYSYYDALTGEFIKEIKMDK